MLGDAELEGLTAQLDSFGQNCRQHHDTLQELLQKYQNLVENYRSLKSDYEEEKESREKYKKLARGQERNPFVLVLVDGDGYIFKDQLLRAGSEGGVSAAQLLSNSIRELLPRLGSGADQCRIMVRIYANLAGLSKTLARAGITGHEARSFAPFTASFTRSQDLFDFIDAGDKKEGADFKIREMFRLFADNSQCKHIFFAGCHDTGYLSLLTPYRGKADRITLLAAASFSPEYNALDLPVVELPSVFRSTYLNANNTMPITKSTPSPVTNEPVCKFFQKGDCRFGNQCKNRHVRQDSQSYTASEDRTEQLGLSISPSPPSFQGFTNHNHNHLNRLPNREPISTLLPTPTPTNEGLIPINKDNERIDTYLTKPTTEAWNLYQARAKQHRLCNEHHLGGRCQNPDCPFDHNLLSPEAIYVMKYILRDYPCPRKGSCRLAKCYQGHICQKDGCFGGKPCKLNSRMHYVDPKVVDWVAPIDVRDAQEQDMSEGSRDEDSA